MIGFEFRILKLKIKKAVSVILNPFNRKAF